MDPRNLMNPPDKKAKSYDGDRWSLYRVLYSLNWTSCLIGLVVGCGITVIMTLSVMLIIAPYLHTQHQPKGSSALEGNDVWTSYGDWKWSPCSVTCGHGIQEGQRSRTCLSETYCTGNETEIMKRHCVSAHCKVDGQWSEWMTENPCSVTCGEGVQTSYRECSNPYPENGGRKCEGQRSRKSKCRRPDCCPGKTITNSLNCQNGWLRNDDIGSCYCFSDYHASWDDAQRYCGTQRSSLTSVYSREETEFLKENAKQLLGADTWIGGKQIYGSYRWIVQTGNTPMNFTYWAPNEPKYGNRDFTCVQLWKQHNYMWDDYNCNYRQPFICKSKL